MNTSGEKSFRMKLRDMENAFKYRRIPYPKRSVELIALLAISCTFFLFMHTNKLNSRLREMEIKLQPSEFSALGLTADHHMSGQDLSKPEDINTLHGTYQYLKSTGQQQRRVRKRKSTHDYVRRLAKNDLADVQDYYDNDNDNDDEAETDYAHFKMHKSRHKHKAQNTRHIHKKHSNHVGVGAHDYDDNDYDEFSVDSLNNTVKADIELVFFNRVPKVGSQSLMELMTRLGHINGFLATRNALNKFEAVLMSPEKQRETIMEVLRMPQPLVYSQHTAYLNFTRFNFPRPIYINLVRDPVERIISWHYYIRAKWYYAEMKSKLGDNAPAVPNDEFLNMDLDTCVREKNIHCQFDQGEMGNRVGDHRRQTLFFCGQNEKDCMAFNSEEVMQRSKRNVEEEYAVVGTWEDTNITLTVLENYIPRFFKHAKVAYYLGETILSKVNKNPVRKPVSAVTREILRKNLTREIEFYEFCKQRLYLQYAALQHKRKTLGDDYQIIY